MWRNVSNIFWLRKRKVTWQVGQAMCLQSDASWHLWPASQDTNTLTTSSWLHFLFQMRIWHKYLPLEKQRWKQSEREQGSSSIAGRFLSGVFARAWEIYLLGLFSILQTPPAPPFCIIIIVSRTWGAGEVIMSFYLHPAWPFLQTTCH